MVNDVGFSVAHYNLGFKNGALLSKVTAADISGIRPQDVEFIFISTEQRNATPAEITELCR
jgi:hypothetical protein